MMVSIFLLISMIVFPAAATVPVDFTPTWTYVSGSDPAVEPVIVNDMVIVAMGDRTIVALDSRTGEVNWAAVLNEEPTGSMLIRNESLYVPGSNGTLMAFSLPTGSLEDAVTLGNFPLLELLLVGDTLVVGDQEGTVSILEADSLQVRSTLMVAPDITDATAWGNYAVFASQDGLITGLDVGTAEMVWQTITADSPGSLTVVDRKILLGTSVGDVFLLNAADGNIEWQQTYGAAGIMDFAISDTNVLGITTNGDLLALDHASGVLRWQGVLTSGGYFASDVCEPNCLIAPTEGTLTTVSPLDQRIVALGEVLGPIDIRPVSSDNLVVVITRYGDVIAWGLPAQ